MKEKSIRRSIFIMLLLSLCMLSGCSSCARSCKSIKSDVSGGLNRTITVYDHNGNKLREWTGKFDVSNSENEVYFDDENNKRVIIHGGIVINEEN